MPCLTMYVRVCVSAGAVCWLCECTSVSVHDGAFMRVCGGGCEPVCLWVRVCVRADVCVTVV